MEMNFIIKGYIYIDNDAVSHSTDYYLTDQHYTNEEFYLCRNSRGSVTNDLYLKLHAIGSKHFEIHLC